MSAEDAGFGIARAAWQQSRHQLSARLWWSIAILCGAGLGTLVWFGARTALIFGVACAIGLLLLAWCWMLLVNSLLVQNQPHAARLVPHHVRQLRRVFMAGWAVFAGVALLSCMPLLSAGSARGLAAVLLTGATAAMLLLCLAWLNRWPISWGFVWVIPVLAGRWMSDPSAKATVVAGVEILTARPLWSAACLAAGLLLAAWLSAQVLLQSGGAAHARQHRRREAWRQTLQPGRIGALQASGGLLQRAMAWPHGWWLARTLARPAGPLFARAMLGLGPAAHWAGQVSGALLLAGIGGLAALTLWAVGAWPSIAHSGFSANHLGGATIGVMILAINPVLQAHAALYNSRREQALLMLLPGMPQGTALNQAVARRQMLHFIVAWAVGAAVSLALTWGTRDASVMAVSYLLASLPMGTLMWRDWSRVPAPTASSTVGLIFIPMALVGGATWAAQVWLGVPPWACVLFFVALAIAAAVWRWQRLRGAAAAFPTGRWG